VKENNKNIALLLSIFAGSMILIYAISNIQAVVDTLKKLIEQSGINATYLNLILKVTAIVYLIEFGKSVCIDAGESALGTKLELAGKVVIVTLTIPVITTLLEQITKIM
jgi:stage III sporulation protein AD